MKQIPTTIRSTAIGVPPESGWMQVLVYIPQNPSLLIVVQDDRVHRSRRSRCNFLPHIVSSSILFTYRSVYISKSDFLFQVVITAVLHEIFDRLGRASDTGKPNALCFTETIVELPSIGPADFIASKALLKAMLQFDEFKKEWSSQRCEGSVVFL